MTRNEIEAVSEAERAAFAAFGYNHVRKLPTGEWAGLQRMAYTTGLFLGLDSVGYRTRFCYERYSDARDALGTWDGKGFPPGFWIKQKPEEIHGPGSEDPLAEREAPPPEIEGKT